MQWQEALHLAWRLSMSNVTSRVALAFTCMCFKTRSKWAMSLLDSAGGRPRFFATHDDTSALYTVDLFRSTAMAILVTGSFNWSPSAAHHNDETLLLIDSVLLARHFEAETDRLWRGAELGVTARLQRKILRRRRACGSGAEPSIR